MGAWLLLTSFSFYSLLGVGEASLKKEMLVVNRTVLFFLGFPGKFSVGARSYPVHSATVSLELGVFENALCHGIAFLVR